MAKKIIFNKEYCTGCGACVIACMDYNNINSKENYRSIVEIEKMQDQKIEVYYDSTACFHCPEPECMPVCPKECFIQDKEHGIVILDNTKCIGCRCCARYCPFDAIKMLNKKAIKCNGCKSEIDKGNKPVCVQNCSYGALVLEEISERDYRAYLKGRKNNE